MVTMGAAVLTVLLAMALGCGGTTETVGSTQTPPVSSSQSPAPAPAPGADDTIAPPTSSAACGAFGGKIHGTSSCVSLARPSAALTAMTTRAAQPTLTASCASKAPVTLATSTVHLECVETGQGTATKHVDVFLVVDEDSAHPSLTGKRILLDAHDGFYDFVNVWLGDRTDKTEITIDYGVLD